MGYFEVKGRVLTVLRLTSRLSLFRKNWALSTRSLSLLVRPRRPPAPSLENGSKRRAETSSKTLKPTRRYGKNL